MYSVVLMMALTSGGDAPAFGGCRGGCYGCYGGCYGCYGGCHGGRRMHGCHGCHGGCHGGCWGGRKHGCHGCYGGCYGGYGGCYGGCYGGGFGYGGVGFGGGMGGMGGMGVPMVPGNVVPGNVTPSTTTPPTTNKTSFDSAAPATLIVTVPADARLSIDGSATTSTTTQRVFVSPALQFGRDYHYTLQAEFQKDGKTVKVSKDVAVQAGEETRISFTQDSTAEVASR